MKKRSRHLIVLLMLCSAWTITALANDQDQVLVDSVNSNWVARNYSQILTDIDARLQTNGADVLALTLKMHYYFYCDTNITNVHAVATIFTNVVNASARTEMNPIAQVMAQRFLDLPLSEPPFSEAQRNSLHSEFSEALPGVEECEAFSLSFNGNRDLHVQSLYPSSGVPIEVFPYDEAAQETGTTSFDRVYFDGTVVTLTAPTGINGNGFSQWNKNGAFYTSNASVTVAISNSVTMSAVYAL